MLACIFPPEYIDSLISFLEFIRKNKRNLMKKVYSCLVVFPSLLLAMDGTNQNSGTLNDTIRTNFHAGQEAQVTKEYEAATPQVQQSLASMTRCMVAESYLRQEKFKEGFGLLDARLTVDNGRDGNKRGERLTNPWTGSNPAEKEITVISEGGFGDVTSRPYLPFVVALSKLGAHVTLALVGGHKKLNPMLEKHSSLPAFGVKFTEIDEKSKIASGDYQVFLMSLPQYVSIDPQTKQPKLAGVTAANEIPQYPTITIQEAAKTYWTDQLSRGNYANKLLVATTHAASLLPPGQHDRGLDRSIPLRILVPAICNKLGIEKVAIINLIAPFNPAIRESDQDKELGKLKDAFTAKRKKITEDTVLSDEAKKAALEKTRKEEQDQTNNLQMSIIPDAYMTAMVDPRTIKADYDKEVAGNPDGYNTGAYVDLGAIVSVLGDAESPLSGAVGSVDTSVINEAGLIATGKQKDRVRIAVLLSKIRDWRWGNGEPSPWYPELTQFAQETQGDCQKVAGDFAQWLLRWQKH